MQQSTTKTEINIPILSKDIASVFAYHFADTSSSMGATAPVCVSIFFLFSASDLPSSLLSKLDFLLIFHVLTATCGMLPFAFIQATALVFLV